MGKIKVINFINLIYNLQIIILLLILFLIPVLSDSSLFLGYELPKLIFFNIGTSLLCLLFSFKVAVTGKIDSLNLFKKIYSQKLLLFLTISLLLLAVISFQQSQNWITSIWGNYDKRFGLYQIFHLIVFGLLSLDIFLDKVLRTRFFEFFKLSFFFPLAFNLLESYLQLKNQTLFEGRIYGTFGQSNFLACFFLMLLPFQYYFLKNGKNYQQKLFQLAGIISSYLLIINADSRMGNIILLLLNFHFLRDKIELLNAKFQNKLGIKSSLISKYLVTTLFLLTIGVFIFSNERFQKNGLVDEGRQLIWKSSIELVKDYPLFGVGPDVSGYFLPDYMKEQGVSINIALDRAHNEYLDIAHSYGIIFTLIFIYLIIRVYFKFLLINSKQSKDKNIRLFHETILISSLIFWIRSLVDVNGIVQYVWVVFLFSVIISQIIENSKPTSQNFIISNRGFKISLFAITSILVVLDLILNYRFYLADRYYRGYTDLRETRYIQNAVEYNPLQIRYRLELLQAKMVDSEKFELEEVVPKEFQELKYWEQYNQRVEKYYEMN